MACRVAWTAKRNVRMPHQPIMHVTTCPHLASHTYHPACMSRCCAALLPPAPPARKRKKGSESGGASASAHSTSPPAASKKARLAGPKAKASRADKADEADAVAREEARGKQWTQH
jgi:hypothetical protein